MGTMGMLFRTSSNAVNVRRIFPLMLATLVFLMWASVAHAQDDAPFDSQYSPPPTTPECDPGDPGASSDPDSGNPGASDDSSGTGGSEACAQAPADPESPIVVLPTTGGSLLAPILLGAVGVVGTGIVVSRKKR